MMKKASIFVAMVFMTVASFGTVQVNWNNTTFLSGLDAGDPEAPTFATQDGFKLLWQLVYTTSSTPETPTMDSTTGEITSYGTNPDIMVLSSRLWQEGSDAISVTDTQIENVKVWESDALTMDVDFACLASGNPLYKSALALGTGGLYSVVFQYIGDATAGDVYYALTDVNMDVNWKNENDTPTPVHFTDDFTKLEHLGHYGVPEPATMSLLGLGALAMVIRRKLRK